MYLEQDNAVQSYIDALLYEPLLKAPAKAPAEVDSSRTTRSRAFVRHLELAQQGTGPSQRGANKRPAWASESLPCLIVKTANLKLAIPQQFIERVEPITEIFDADTDLLSAPGDGNSGSSTLGTIVTRQEGTDRPRCHLVDTAKLVMPERYSPEMRGGYRHAVIMKELDWALAVDAIGAQVDYASSKVRWRSLHTRREWLAGTVIADMCAIVDIDAVYRSMLADSVLADSGKAGATPSGRPRE